MAVPKGPRRAFAPLVSGDTLAVNGQVICAPSHCPYGFPHDSIAIQRPGTATFRMGTRNTGGTGCVADCKTMGTAYVPLNPMTHPSASHVQLGVLPSGEGYDLGTVVSMSHVSGHGWVAYTKRNDIIGSTLERLNAWYVTGPWYIATQQWQAKPAPGCAWTYSAETHPASPAPPGTMLVSWASNHDAPGTACDMQPKFTDLPIGSPPPRTDGSGCGPPQAEIIASRNGPGLKESGPVSHRVGGREVRRCQT
jgi:hypothetical protein